MSNGEATKTGCSPPPMRTTTASTRSPDYIFSRPLAFPLRIFTLSESDIDTFCIHSTAGGNHHEWPVDGKQNVIDAHLQHPAEQRGVEKKPLVVT